MYNTISVTSVNQYKMRIKAKRMIETPHVLISHYDFHYFGLQQYL